MKSLLVIRYKTVVMQRLLDLVQRGYHYYVSGTVPKNRVESLCKKFDELYFISDNARRRSYRKSKGEGNAFLLLCDLEKNGTLHWWLLATNGEHPIHSLEKLFDANHRAQRVRLTGYELVQLSKDKEKGGGVRWTWRMTDTTYDEWREAIRTSVRSKNNRMEIKKIVSSLFQAPGFGQTRVQVGKLISALRGEWVRLGNSVEELLLPPTLHFVRRIADEDFTVDDWLKEQKK
jgi:hypothetical protein